MIDFLSEPWWVGVQGIAALIALTAVIIAVVDFMIRMDDAQPQAMSFTITRKADAEYTEVTISARPMGAAVLYEPAWVIYGRKIPLGDNMPPVLTATDEPETLTIRVPSEELPSVWVGITWVETQGRGALSSSYARCSRVSLDATARYQRWVTYRWWRWPRKNVGRWVESKTTKRSRLLMPSE